jgi:hypothetical protein
MWALVISRFSTSVDTLGGMKRVIPIKDTIQEIYSSYSELVGSPPENLQRRMEGE